MYRPILEDIVQGRVRLGIQLRRHCVLDILAFNYAVLCDSSSTTPELFLGKPNR